MYCRAMTRRLSILAAGISIAGCALPTSSKPAVDSLQVASFCAPGDPVTVVIEGKDLVPAVDGGPGEEAELALLRVELHRVGDLFGQPDGLEASPVVL